VTARLDAPVRAETAGNPVPPPSSLGALFAESARRYPDEICLIDGDKRVSYRQMAREAAALATVIGPQEIVAVLGERETPVYRAYLAALYAGAAVAPLSLDFPPERNARILSQAGIRCLIHTERRGDPLLEAQLAAIGGVTLVNGLDVPPEPVDPRPADVPEESLAYLIFTSGSTGEPKGVPIKHRSARAFLRAVLPGYAAGPGDVFAQCHALTFDFSVFEMWGAWASGAAALVVPRLQALDPGVTLPGRGATVWCCTPSLIDAATAGGRLPQGALPGLRYLIIGGEPLPAVTVARARAAAPNATIDNVYGPTETTVWSTFYRVEPGQPMPANGIVPIGTPCSGVATRISDAGELLVSGPQIFDGYLDAGQTAIKTVTADGQRWYRTGDLVAEGEGGIMLHRGRIDSQVKVNGYRIELSEIEHVASQLLDGRRVVVVRTSTGPADAGLALFVEPPEVDEDALRRRLARLLPAYMVPRSVLTIDQIPLTAHGKLDRDSLSDRATAGHGRQVAPREEAGQRR
jgi:amino acid adenylation domain-containing protein